jgi:putative ABC transport system permease protein
MNIITITFNNIWHRKIRSLLTVLGVGISISAFVAIIGLTNGLKESLVSTFKSRGTDLVIIEKGIVDILSSNVDITYKEKLKFKPQVEEVSPILLDLYSFKFKQYILVYGWEPDSYLFGELKIQGNSIKQNNDVILGSLAAKRLNKKIGDVVDIKGAKFTVAGIFQSKSVLEDGAAIIPLERLQELKNAKNKISLFNIKVKTPQGARVTYTEINNSIDQAQAAIAEAFPELEVKNVQSFISNNTPMYMVFNFTWAIGIVAFIIVILGIVNTMATSVLERTQEIGILLAIGWRNFSVVAMVLGEAMLLGLLGGVVGVGLGYFLMSLLVSSPQLSGMMVMNYDLYFILQVLSISLGLGFLSGIYPAIKAISIEPMKVLRYG